MSRQLFWRQQSGIPFKLLNEHGDCIHFVTFKQSLVHCHSLLRRSHKIQAAVTWCGYPRWAPFKTSFIYELFWKNRKPSISFVMSVQKTPNRCDRFRSNPIYCKFYFGLIWLVLSAVLNKDLILRTGRFKKKVTLSHVYNEVTSEPTITPYASIVRKALKVLIWNLINTQYGNPVSHCTRQSDSPFLPRLSPACPCLWLPQIRWCTVSILEDHLAGVVRRRRPTYPQPLHSCNRVGLRRLQDTEHLLLWSRHFATRSPLVAAARNTFPRQLRTNFESFPDNCWKSRDCWLTGYFTINMWKCYLLVELPCVYFDKKTISYTCLMRHTSKERKNNVRLFVVYYLRRRSTFSAT
jgi:hypothetical protein